jgi:membrane-bound lytic murein transglycosylase MltF
MRKAKLMVKNRGCIYGLLCGFAILVALVVPPSTFGQKAGKLAPPPEEDQKQLRGLPLNSSERTGDFDMMLESRVIRVSVPYTRTLYFNDKGRERGITADHIRDFENYLNKKYKNKIGKRPLTVLIIPETRDRLLTSVEKGLSDIAAGNLTVTEDRLKTVDFVAPEDIPVVHEVLAAGPTSPAVSGLDDVAGKTIHVRRSSSYYESLVSLNRRFEQEKKEPVKIVLVPDALEDEDLMEMLNAGLFEFIVVDDWLLKIWAQVLPKIKMRDDIVFRSGGRTGWAVRKGSPKLEAEIRDFNKNYLKKNGIIAYRLKQYYKRVKQLKNPTGTAAWKRFEKTVALFEKYGHKYQFDPLMLAAQGYQESTLNQTKRSQAGAIGIMQIMPETGAELNVGDITVAEPNIQAGAKYMSQLMTRYFPDADFNEQNRTLFAFASYNAGPGNISKMRKLAETRGLDPNTWFNNVEVVTAQKIGIETTTYVRNIYKYYAAYKLMLEAQAKQIEAREQVVPGKHQ